MNTVYNARITLLATALNNLRVGAIITGIVGPLVNDHIGNFIQTIEWFMVGVNLIAVAQGQLGSLRA